MIDENERAKERWERRQKRERQVRRTKLAISIATALVLVAVIFAVVQPFGRLSGSGNTQDAAGNNGSQEAGTLLTEGISETGTNNASADGVSSDTGEQQNMETGETTVVDPGENADAETEAETKPQTEQVYNEADLTAWDPTQVTHIFFHSLVVDPAKGFTLKGESGWDAMTPGFCQWMTTVYEFKQTLQQMYDKGYVMIDLHDMVEETTDDNGVTHMTAKMVKVPNGKIPFVMSFDDLSYYHAYDNRGIASKIVLDENGKPTCEYIQDDGTTVTGAYDYIPILDEFLVDHPDFSWKGAKGVIALTGYDGILGYRTDIQYKTRESLQEDQAKWLENHPDYDYDTECAEAKKVADAIKADGWTFASHTWGHIHIGDADMEHVKTDTQKWLDNVAPLIGGTDTIIFAHGQDLANWDQDYSSTEKFQYLKSKGFDIYCNVDSSQYFVQIGDEYLRMGRRDVDGYRLWLAVYGGEDSLSDLIDPATVIDPDRPTDAAMYQL